MADKTIYVGAKGTIPKLLHDNGDGSYSDSVYVVSDPPYFSVNYSASGAQSNHLLQAAPGSGKSFVIDEIVTSAPGACIITFVEDPAGTPVTALGPYNFAAANTLVFKPAFTTTVNKAFGVTLSAAGAVTVKGHVVD